MSGSRRLAIAPVILAAGKSSRMGATKALLSIGRQTYLERIIATARAAGWQRPIVVGPGSLRDSFACGGVPSAHWVETPESGTPQMLASLLLGLRRVDSAANWAAVWPVDCPAVSRQTLTLLSNAAMLAPGRVLAISPAWEALPGHPVLLSRRLIPAIGSWQGGEGLRGFLAARPGCVRRVPVREASVTDDIDLPGDHAALVARESAPR